MFFLGKVGDSKYDYCLDRYSIRGSWVTFYGKGVMGKRSFYLKQAMVNSSGGAWVRTSDTYHSRRLQFCRELWLIAAMVNSKQSGVKAAESQMMYSYG